MSGVLNDDVSRNVGTKCILSRHDCQEAISRIYRKWNVVSDREVIYLQSGDNPELCYRVSPSQWRWRSVLAVNVMAVGWEMLTRLLITVKKYIIGRMVLMTPRESYKGYWCLWAQRTPLLGDLINIHRGVSQLEGATTSIQVRKSIRHLPKALPITHPGFVTSLVQGLALEFAYRIKCV